MAGYISTSGEAGFLNKIVINSSRGAGGILFITNNAGSTGGRMIVSSAGSVGIGTTAPTALLDVNGSLEVLGNSNTIGNIFTTGGNVGINTTSPNSKLSISGSESTINGTN